MEFWFDLLKNLTWFSKIYDKKVLRIQIITSFSKNMTWLPENMTQFSKNVTLFPEKGEQFQEIVTWFLTNAYQFP